MINKINRFFIKPKAEKTLFFQAYFYCFLSRLIILFVPVKYYASKLGRQNVESNFTISKEQEKIVKSIQIAIEQVNKNAFWRNNCFAQATGAKQLLSKYKISSTLYLGISKDDKKNLIAHAWLRCGQLIVTGKNGYERFTVVTVFS